VHSETVSFAPRGLPGLTLEGRLLDGGGQPCLISHPHPLAGGTMDHGVVVALWKAAAARGLRALRYNFRGVGASTGELTSKSPLPTADLGGAVDFLGGGPLIAVGYSYGARTTLHAIHAGESIERAALVGLPTRSPANRAAMANLLLGRRIRSEEYVGSHPARREPLLQPASRQSAARGRGPGSTRRCRVRVPAWVNRVRRSTLNARSMRLSTRAHAAND